jgi:hypothetical protein
LVITWNLHRKSACGVVHHRNRGGWHHGIHLWRQDHTQRAPARARIVGLPGHGELEVGGEIGAQLAVREVLGVERVLQHLNVPLHGAPVSRVGVQ